MVVSRFYFHLVNDLDVPDLEGAEFPDVETARRYAVGQVRAIAGETVKESGRLVLNHRIVIEDEQRANVATVWFRDALKIEA